jgi:hypothetical protein
MMNQFHDTPISNRATGHTFMHRSYCESPKEAEDLARLTFTNPAVYAVGDGKTAHAEWLMGIQNLDEPQQQPTIQTELF